MDAEQEDGFKDYGDSTGIINEWAGKNNTRIIVRHMETIFNNYLMSGNNEKVEIQWATTDAEGHSVVKTLEKLPETNEELGNMMEILQKANGDLGLFRQFAYPAAYSCYLYEPSIKEGEYLDPQYQRNNWYLPSEGELCRQYIYFALSRTGGWGDTYSVGQNTLPAASVIEQKILEAYNSSSDNYIKLNVSYESIQSGTYTASEINAINQYFQSLVDADKPLYSLLLWRAGLSGASPFTNHTAGLHWSSTEYSSDGAWFVHFFDGYPYGSTKTSSYVVRPAVAYEFSL